ncbi:hypothetical protein X975_07805, partial [Stegodyphus mimosarum]
MFDFSSKHEYSRKVNFVEKEDSSVFEVANSLEIIIPQNFKEAQKSENAEECDKDLREEKEGWELVEKREKKIMLGNNITRSWKDVSPDTLKNAWHNLWPASIFHGEDDENDSHEYESFWISQTKGETSNTDFIKKCGETVINEDDITEVFNCNDNAPIVNKLMDSEICNMVLNPENTE